MRLGEILLAKGFVDIEAVERAVEQQQLHGGLFGETLVALGAISKAQLDIAVREVPRAPFSIAETGVSPPLLLNLMLKFMSEQGRETATALADAMHLNAKVVQEVMRDAAQRGLIVGNGSVTIGIGSHIRYALSDRGREAAADALAHDLYLGPAPISLAAYQSQIRRQAITNETLDEATLRQVFAGLRVPEALLRKLGPAINGGRSILLYGAAGNGKTSIATQLGIAFRHVIFVPYAVEIDGHVMVVHDPTLHKPALADEAARETLANTLQGVGGEEFDRRWAACRRPIAFAGGELTLEMLDLKPTPGGRFYEAPLHVKALGGIFIIDDFGRQAVPPGALLNRWIVPMESRVDYHKLASGRSFQLPFDELLIFSTNLEPRDLMDPAFLRRIPYKIRVEDPSVEEYRGVFADTARKHGLGLTESVFTHVVAQLTSRHKIGLFYFQPRFICEQVMAMARFEGRPPSLTVESAQEALVNLYVQLA